ncbi:hypothetical protein DVH05_001555 [Phytophthora capsici]|nr:hypothetical protein DVH05_001555 [Phytophthora capsici]
MEDEIAEYKHTVTRRGKRKAQNALLRMGRPMWYSNFRSSKRSTRLEEATNLAARKLMLGWSIEKRNYTEETMFGVASFLCRLGVRLLSTSALASRVVADFMAILVNYEMDGYLSTYALDPVLTLGATKVWYELDNGLAKYILPQLEKLILNETLDSGGVGVMVARILRLLAMDTCAFGGGDSPDYNRIGQFVPLETFLEKFITEDIPIYYEGKKNPVEYLRPAFDEWRSKWRKWYVGFTHFVQLALGPNEDTLWYLLGRRAAGTLPARTELS